MAWTELSERVAGSLATAAHPIKSGTQSFERYSGGWTGVTAEVIELKGSGPYLASLRSDKPRLVVVLEEIGGRIETRIAPDRPSQPRRPGLHHLVFIPRDTSVWEYANGFKYIRRVIIDFDLTAFPGTTKLTKIGVESAAPRRLSDARLFGLADLLADECAKPRNLNPDYCNSLAKVISCKLFELVETENGSDGPRRLNPNQLRRVMDYMDQQSSASIQLNDLAKMVGLSQSYFSRAFKASIGMTPLRWFQTTRIQHAQQMLLESKQSLTDVALATGFADQSHFTRAFRLVVGESPGAWRRSHRAAIETPA